MAVFDLFHMLLDIYNGGSSAVIMGECLVVE